MKDDDTQTLRDRIEQLEAALAAASAGELDAVVLQDGHTVTYSEASAERPYRLMVEQMAEGALTLDEVTGRILYSNAAFAGMTGRLLERLLGRRFAELVDPVHAEAARELVAGVRPTRRDLELVRADGQALPVAASAVSVEGPAGRVRCLVISDLRERRRTERLRRSERELRDEARRTEEFIAMLGHELRNPLAPIRHAAELLTEATLTSEQLQTLQATIVRQTAHLKRLVDDLLDIARVTRGSLKLDRRPIDLRETVDAALEAARSLFTPRGRTLEVVLPAEPLEVVVDGVRLTQVVTNLLSNAAKFTDQGGHVLLAVDTDGGDVRIIVEDDGRGIEPEALSTVFDPFVRAAAVRGDSMGGLGLGLALVKRVVALHEGSVDVASGGSGQGTRFVVKLPRAPAGSTEEDAVRAVSARARPGGPGRGDTQRLSVASIDDAVARATTASQSGASEPEASSEVPHRVLVCDDNADAAEMVALLVQSRGHLAEVSATGTDALARAEAMRPSFVLLDIGLPDMSGYDVARRLRGISGLDDTVIVALTGYGQDSDRTAALEAGCDLHLVKPVTGERLFEALRTRRARQDPPTT